MNISYDVWNVILNLIMYELLTSKGNNEYLFSQINKLVLIDKNSRRQVYRFLYDNTKLVNINCSFKIKTYILQLYKSVRQAEIVDSEALRVIFNAKETKETLKIKHCYNDFEIIQSILKSTQELELLIVINVGVTDNNKQYIITGIRHYGEDINVKYIGFSLRICFGYNLQAVKEIEIYHVSQAEMRRISRKFMAESNLSKQFRRIKEVPKIEYIQKYRGNFKSDGERFDWKKLKEKKGIISTDLRI